MPVIRFGCHTDVGRLRDHNEDSHRADPLGNGVLLTVSDGLGGARGGEVASRLAADGLWELLQGHPDPADPLTSRATQLAQAARELDARIRSRAVHADLAGMGATLSTLWLENWQGWWVQVGDSRIYRFRSGILQRLSPDHSPVGRMLADGSLSEEEARRHPLRHVIDQCLGGSGLPADPATGHLALELGDVFLLCSDGLSDGLRDSEIARELTANKGLPADGIARSLVGQALAASGNDNITAIVAEVASAPSRSFAPIGMAAALLFGGSGRSPER